MLAKADRDDPYQIAARHLHIKDNHDPVDHVESSDDLDDQAVSKSCISIWQKASWHYKSKMLIVATTSLQWR